MAFNRAGGWNSKLIKELCKGDILDKLRNVITGYEKIVPVEHFIDMGAKPFIPDEGWEVAEHTGSGLWKWEPKKIQLIKHLTSDTSKMFRGYDVEKDMNFRTSFNANLLDYLLKYPGLIPKEWHQKSIFFWGTKYKLEGGPCVRFFCI